MDGHMEMPSHYEFDLDGNPVGIKESLQALGEVKFKGCPECRHPLREIQRYNRVTRKALLDETTKKFLSWSNATFVNLAIRYEKEVQRLSELSVTSMRSAEVESQVTGGSVKLSGSGKECVKTLRRFRRLEERLFQLFRFRSSLAGYLKQVNEREQPFQKVFDLCRAQQGSEETARSGFKFDETIVQTRQRLLAESLLLRCDATILGEALKVRAEGAGLVDRNDWVVVPISVDLSRLRLSCEDLEKEARARQQPRIEAEALLSQARFAALERTFRGLNGSDNLASALREVGDLALKAAFQLSQAYPRQTTGIGDEMEVVERMLRDSVFYTQVTSEERMEVLQAMSREFRGTGHWYICPNGHPYTIGECGGAMQASRCPQCNAAIGGRDHDLAEGNERADDLEAELRQMRI